MKQAHLVRFALPLITCILFSGCSTSKLGQNTAILGGSALGAYVAHEASDGDAAITTAGAAAGGLAAMGLNALAEENERLAYRSGYEAAMNQNVKQQYWIIQNRQREDTAEQQESSETPSDD